MSKLVLAALVLLAAAAPARATRDDTDAVRAVVTQHGEQLRRCYQRGLREAPDLGRKLVVRFQVGAHGRPSRILIVAERSTLHDTAVETCVTRVFRSMRFGRAVDAAWHESPLVFPAS